MLTKQKKIAVLSTGIAALIAGACLSARPAAALPMTLSMSHLTRPVYDHDKDARQDRWQGRYNQGSYNQGRGNQNADGYRGDQDNRRRAERERREREEQRRRYEDQHRDRDSRNRR